MQTQILAQTALEISSLSYGCMRIAGTWNPAEVDSAKREAAFAALAAAYEAGYTLFDHADIYARGACETLHGDFLRENPSLRRETIIATKCGIRFAGDPTENSPHRYDFSAAHIVWSCEESLRRLGVETIEIYQLHRPDWLMDPDEVAEAFTTLQAQGKVRFFGVSNFLPHQLSALQAALPFPLVVNQVEIHLGRLAPFQDGTLHQCLELGITPLSWSPLAGGWLGEGGTAPEGRPEMAALLAKMDALARDHGVTRTEIALAWLLQHPAEIVPIVGSTNPARIKQAAKAAEIDLGRDDWNHLTIAARGKGWE